MRAALPRREERNVASETLDEGPVRAAETRSWEPPSWPSDEWPEAAPVKRRAIGWRRRRMN